MVKVLIHGNAFAHKMAYGRGVHLVSKTIADRLVNAGVAKVIEEEEIQTAVIEPEETKKAVVDTKPKPRKRKKGK